MPATELKHSNISSHELTPCANAAAAVLILIRCQRQ